MKNGNRYYNQPLYAILKRDKDGNIRGYAGKHGWSSDKVYVFDGHDTGSIKAYTGKKNLPYRLAEGKKYIKNLLNHKKLPIGEDDVFFVRLRSKKCPIKVDFPHIYSHKNAYLVASDRFLPFKVLTKDQKLV